MKSLIFKPAFISVICGVVLGFISFTSASRRLWNYAQGFADVELDYSDVFVMGFLHFDFDRFDYLWRRDTSLLLIPIMFYLVGSMLGAQFLLKRNKSYNSFIYHRYKNNTSLGTALSNRIWLPIFLYAFFYFSSFILGMVLFSGEFISHVFTITIFQLSAFFILCLLALSFLGHLMFITYIKKESAIAMIINVVAVILILLITIHARFINLAVFDDFTNLMQSITIWLAANAVLWFILKCGLKYEA